MRRALACGSRVVLGMCARFDDCPRPGEHKYDGACWYHAGPVPYVSQTAAGKGLATGPLPDDDAVSLAEIARELRVEDAANGHDAATLGYLR